MTSLRDLIAADMADGGVFFPKDSGGNPSGFNEDFLYYPAYDAANVETVNAVVDRRGLQGTREVRGDGVTFNRPEGKSVRQTAHIYVPITLNVREEQPNQDPDVFKDGTGMIWVVKRIVDHYTYYDPDTSSMIGVQKLHCVHRGDVTVRFDSRAG